VARCAVDLPGFSGWLASAREGPSGLSDPESPNMAKSLNSSKSVDMIRGHSVHEQPVAENVRLRRARGNPYRTFSGSCSWNPKLETAERLAEQYQVSASTIEKDGAFAEAVDTLEQQVRKDLRDVVTKRKGRTGEARSPKGQVTRAGKAVKERRVTPMPFMQRAEWKDHQVIEAIDLIQAAKIGTD